MSITLYRFVTVRNFDDEINGPRTAGNNMSIYNVIARDAIRNDVHKHFAILTGRYGKTWLTPDTSVLRRPDPLGPTT